MATEATRNWIPDNTRFPKPPAWFLKQLWDFDDALVVLPSRSRRAYILARRRNLTLRSPYFIKVDREMLRATRGNDTDMLADNSLVFVDLISGVNMHGAWSPLIFDELRKRDIWKDGADKYNDKLLAEEKSDAEKKRAKWLGDIDHRSRDAYRSYKARTGQRNQHANDNHKKAARVYKPSSSSTTGSGIVITG